MLQGDTTAADCYLVPQVLLLEGKKVMVAESERATKKTHTCPSLRVLMSLLVAQVQPVRQKPKIQAARFQRFAPPGSMSLVQGLACSNGFGSGPYATSSVRPVRE